MIKYRYASLTTGKRWYVSYYIQDPDTGEMVRKRVYIDHLRGSSNKRRYASRLIEKINDRLDNGWNPLIQDDNRKQYLNVCDALREYLNIKLPALRPRSRNAYNSHINLLTEWLEKSRHHHKMISEFSDHMAQEYADYLATTRKLSNNTYNKYLTDYSGHFRFLKKRGYLRHNPFEQIDRRPKEDTGRQPMTTAQLQQLSTYIRQHEPGFLLPCLLLYYCGLRPYTIMQLRVGDVDIDNNVIHIRSGMVKNHKARRIEMVRELRILLEAYIGDAPAIYYLVTSKWTPGPKQSSRNRLSEKFREIRDKLGFQPEISFYSIKDTVADRMDAVNVPLKEISMFFDHADVATTAKYIKKLKALNTDQLFKKVQKL